MTKSQSWFFRPQPWLRFSIAGTATSVFVGLNVGWFISHASWEDIRPFFAIGVGLYASFWFSRTFCREFHRDAIEPKQEPLE